MIVTIDPPLASPKLTGEELNPGDRVEGLGNFGKPTGMWAPYGKPMKWMRWSNGMATVR
jgi:hypothetical protein